MRVRRRPQVVPVGDDVVELRVATELAADDDHLELWPGGQHRLEVRKQRGLDHEHLGVAVLEVVDVVVDAVHRVDRNGHGADPHRPEERRVKRGRVVEHHQHALFALHAEAVQVRPDGGDHPPELAVGDHPLLRDQRDLVPSAGL